MLIEGERFAKRAADRRSADLDLDLLRQERISTGSFDDVAQAEGLDGASVPHHPRSGSIRRATMSASSAPSSGFPSSRADRERLAQDCYEAYNIQVDGLRQRLSAIGTQHITIGVSGGLDSTHALIVAARAFDLLGLPRGPTSWPIRCRASPPAPTPRRTPIG